MTAAVFVLTAIAAVVSVLVTFRTRRATLQAVHDTPRVVDWTDYKRLVDRLIDNAHSTMPFTEILDVHYMVGDNPEKDRVIENHETEPSGPEGLTYRWFSQSAEETPLEGPAQVIDLGLKRDGPAAAEKVELKVVPLDSTSSEARGAIMFVPPIRGTVAWSVTYRVPGLWSRLRDTGASRVWYSVDGDYCKGLDVNLTLPRGWRFDGDPPPLVSGETGLWPTVAKGANGEMTCTWTSSSLRQERVPAGRYSGEVRVTKDGSGTAVAGTG